MTNLEAAAFHHQALTAAGLWAALSLLLVLFLSARISGFRRRLRVSLGDGGDEGLNVAVRSFGNAVEYLPLGLIAVALVALVGYGAAIVHGLGAALVLGRVLHAWGMASAKQPAPGRMIGMVLTYLVFLASAGLLIAATVL